MGGLLEACWVRGCVGSLEGGAEAGCWDGAPMLSPIPYLSDNLHIFISNQHLSFELQQNTHQKPQKNIAKNGNGGYVL